MSVGGYLGGSYGGTWRRWCTSPWPWGLVSSFQRPLVTMRPIESDSAGTLSCISTVTWEFADERRGLLTILPLSARSDLTNHPNGVFYPLTRSWPILFYLFGDPALR